MKKKMYWKMIRQSLMGSKGRFFSIFSLMLIGSMALVGLKVAAPNMEETAQDYIEKGNMFDLVVMSDLGISQTDKEELDTISTATVEYAYFKDVLLGEEAVPIRLFSIPKTISRYHLREGKAATSQQEILLSSHLKGIYQIGDTISLDEGDKQASVLAERTFVVTGFADSSDIWGRIDLGPAGIGSGLLAGYAFVPEEAFESEVYMMARIRYHDVDSFSYYQTAYKEAMMKHQEELNDLLADNGNERLVSIQQDSQQEMQVAQQAIQDAQQKLTAAADEFTQHEASIKQAKQELAQAWEKLEQDKASLHGTNEELSQKKEALDHYQEQIEPKKKRLDSSRNRLEESWQNLSQLETRLEQLQKHLNQQQTRLAQKASQIENAQIELQTRTQSLQEQRTFAIAAGDTPDEVPEIRQAQQELHELESEIVAAQITYQAELTAYREEEIAYEEEKARYQVVQQYYEYDKSQYQKDIDRYQEEIDSYHASLAEYEANRLSYEQAIDEVSEIQSHLRSQEKALEEQATSLETQKSEFDKTRLETEQDIKKANKQLQLAQAELARIDSLEYKVYTRASLPGGSGYANYDSSTQSIAAVGTIFPAILYVVAALVTSMTMTRFVDEERSTIGILRALGYTKSQITLKFVLYGVASALSGALIGILLGNIWISPMVSRIITDTTILGESHLHIYPSWFFLAIIFSLLASVLPAYWVVQKELREQPAQLLQAKPPASGAKIFLEFFPLIWKRLTFTQKVTARNIFRYKKRMTMTIVGVAGTVALLFAGLGIRSSISRVIDQQFHQLLHYDMIVVEQGLATEKELTEVQKAVTAKGVKENVSVAYYDLTESIEGQDDVLTITMLVSPEKHLSSFITLRDSVTGQELSLPETGVILSQKLASLYQVNIGDSIVVHLQQETVTLPVAGISEMYAGHFIYLSDTAYQEATKKEYQSNAHLLVLEDNQQDMIETWTADFLDMKGVVAVIQNTSLKTLLETIVTSLQSVMLILVVLSILLGMVILYNLTTINLEERIRELSTVKVLGFYDKEVTLYIYRETIVLSLIGVLVGLCAGVFLHRLLLHVIASPAIFFAPSVSLDVYFIPVGAVFGILIVLGYLTHRRLRALDMLEALKSGE